MNASSPSNISSRPVQIDAAGVRLEGTLDVPAAAEALVIFAHGSGSSRFSPRNRRVAEILFEGGLATLLFDLLSPAEESGAAYNRKLRFDIPLLAERLGHATAWARRQPETASLRLGYFGASTGAAAALVAAAEPGRDVRAIVSRGGRPDLAAGALERVTAPTLFIVGGDDHPTVGLNQEAAARMRCPHQIEMIPGATHLFEELGALDLVAAIASRWFTEKMRLGRSGGSQSA